MAQSDLSSRYVAPVAVLASVAVAVGVWLAPTGWLDPERRTNDADEPRPPEAVAPTPTGGQTQRRPDWIVLGEALSLVRDPVVVPNEPETPAEEDPGAAGARGTGKIPATAKGPRPRNGAKPPKPRTGPYAFLSAGLTTPLRSTCHPCA
jgi:hypothetical protein